MHPIVIYELVKTRMELDHAAERRRLARAELPVMQQASAGRRPPEARWRRAIRWRPWIRASSRDQGQPGQDPRELPRAGRYGIPAAARPAEELAGMPRAIPGGRGSAPRTSIPQEPKEMVAA